MLGKKKHLVWNAADEQVHTFLELMGAMINQTQII